MKRTMTGMIAYGKIIGTKLPEKTETYTPISHASVINRVRSEITTAGYVITGEEYRCSNDGQVAIGTFRMNYKSDPDIELSANFLNSYNKQYAFRFNLGGLVKVCMNGMMLNNNKFGSYKRVHKGSADLLAEGKISDFIKDSEIYWNSLVEHKDVMKGRTLTEIDQHDILGKLFLRKNLLTTMQLNTVKKEMEKPTFDYKVDPNCAWAMYNHITLALKDSHPATWIDDQIAVHEVFAEMLGFEVEEDTNDMVVDYTGELAEVEEINVVDPVVLTPEEEEECYEEFYAHKQKLIQAEALTDAQEESFPEEHSPHPAELEFLSEEEFENNF